VKVEGSSTGQPVKGWSMDALIWEFEGKTTLAQHKTSFSIVLPSS